MSEVSILLTNTTINIIEYGEKPGKIGIAIFSKSKNVKEIKGEGFYTCYEFKKGNSLAEIDFLHIKGKEKVTEINSFELKKSRRITREEIIQLIKQSLFLISATLYGFRMEFENGCIYLSRLRRNMKIKVMHLNGHSEGDLKNLPLHLMLNKLYEEAQIFSDVGIYFNENSNTFDIHYKLALPHSIYDDRFSISMYMRNSFLKTIIQNSRKIASEILKSDGTKRLSYLLTMYYDLDFERIDFTYLNL